MPPGGGPVTGPTVLCFTRFVRSGAAVKRGLPGSWLAGSATLRLRFRDDLRSSPAESLGELPRTSARLGRSGRGAAIRATGVAGCCAAPGSCTPAADAPARCDAPRWPAFVERPDSYAYEYRTTCDALPDRQDDTQCDAKPLDWLSLTAELCAGRPVIAALHSPGSPRGHTVVVKGFSSHGGRRVLVVDPKRLCSPDRECEGELDEAVWLTYDEYVSGWSGLAHWVDFYRIKRR